MNNGKIKHKSTKSAPQSLLYLCQKLPRCSAVAAIGVKRKAFQALEQLIGFVACLPGEGD